ncbi:MAG: TonB-dependent receptor [Bacteroidales bacterium]|nr:TonB-dependent receptor [Bacteroidales bacterium]
MGKFKLFLVPLFVVLFTAASIAQGIRGTVIDENGEPIIGVTVMVKGTFVGSITDAQGNYSIANVPGDGVLVFSYIGMKTQEIPVNNRSVIDVTMAVDAFDIAEVVAIGYGTARKQDVTGSITKVDPGSIESRPITSAEQALQGYVPGLNIAQRAASPGDLGTISIRGLGSITAGSSPLWVIDGFPTDQRNAQSINPADIQSVEVLKDASATAIYGSRGANGVIIVTTKSGQAGKSTLNVSVSGGVASPGSRKHIDVMNAEEYVQFHKEQNNGVIPDFIANYWDGTTDTDWLDQVFRNGAFQNYAISASGGDEKVTYLLSANYLNQQGIIKGEDYNKYSARLRVDYKPIEKLTLGLNLAPNLSNIARNSRSTDGTDWSSLYAQALMMAPIVPIYRENGTYSMNSDLAGALPVGNPLETMKNYDSDSELFRMIGGVYGKLEIIEGLTFMTNLSANLGNDKSETYYMPTIGQTVPIDMSAVSSYSVGQGKSLGWLNENTLNYKKVLNDHSFDVLGGFTAQKNSSESVNASVQRLRVPGIRNVNIGDSETLNGANGSTANSLVSYLGRLNYAYKEKYLATATVRTDGSSRFGANNRYHTFGSFALAWRFSEEDFMAGFESLSSGKLRLSYGETGSNSIRDFDSRASMSTVRHAFGPTAIFGTVLGLPGNEFLTWETSNQFDIGLDLGFMNNRINMIIDFYDNKTTSLLLTKNVVPSSGYGSYLTNIGSMRNRGVELSALANIIESPDWTWSIGGNLTYNDQEILDLGGDDEILNFFGALRRVVGGELQQMRGPKVLGISREGDDLSAQPIKRPGAYLYEDLDGDGTISNFLGADGQLIGDTNVDLIYGFNTYVRYKNLDLNVLFNGQAGAYVYDFWLIQVAAPFRRTNLSKEFWYDGRYIDESNPGDGKTPAAYGFDSGIATVASGGIQKTDYLRIRNVTLSYNFPGSLLSSNRMSGGKIFISVENLHTFTNFSGGNPEARRASAGGPALIGGSQIAEVTDGRELGLNSPPGLPLPQTWTVGLSINF